MGIDVGIDGILGELLGRPAKQRERIGLWLETVAADAEVLASTWRGRFAALTVADAKPEAWDDFYIGLEAQQIIHFENPTYVPRMRLELAYRDATQVLGGKVGADFQESFVHTLARAIVSRDSLFVNFRKWLPELNAAKQFGTKLPSTESRMRELSDVLLTLERESAALRHIARLYRVSAFGTE